MPDSDTSETIRLKGTAVLEHGLPANKLKLRLYRRDFGGDVTPLSETITGADGRYTFVYAGRVASSLELRAVGGDGVEVLLTKPLNNLTAEARADLNVLVPRKLQRLDAEYTRMSAALKEHIGGQMSKLANAKEDDKQQDLTVLNRATGWDARLIALAAITEQLAAHRDVKEAGLAAVPLYGVLRAGLPSDKLLLAQVEPDVIDMALKKVRDAGIVSVTDSDIADFIKKFEGFANKTRLAVPAPGSRSTYGELLRSSGLPQEAQDKFAAVYFTHRGSGDELWQEARKAGLDGAQIGKLQLQGKLAFLAGNSEAMTTRLIKKVLRDPVELVDQGFHDASAWETELFAQARIPPRRRGHLNDEDREKLDALIPTVYVGERVETRLQTYAEDMARKVRLSYPTQVLARLMEEKDQNFKLSSDHDATVELLKSAMAQGFRFGATPVAAFLKSNAGVRGTLSDAEFHAAGQQMKMLQRVWQMTPATEAMPVLMRLGMTSAFDVTAYPEEHFIASFKNEYRAVYKNKAAPSGMPELISQKAKQVSSVTYGLFAIAAEVNSELPVAAFSAPVQVRESVKEDVKKELIKHYPTMESLFGSMDYCECEHCRSVLSPAAYLVDLLQFVDIEPEVWKNFLVDWEGSRTEYQADWRENPDGSVRKKERRKPFDALIERRPDLPHITLTCENTNTALPYIDIVNEILEYYVANGKLAKEAARDTGDAVTAELLAEPQNVIKKAYDEVGKALYPVELPFDPWIETVRQFCDYFGTPLHRVLEVLRPDEDVFAWIQNATNVGNATVSVSNADAAKFKNGVTCTYFSVSANAGSGESKRISAIGSPDSGGAGQTTVTFAGAWTKAPSIGDCLVSRPLENRAAIFMESLGLSPAEVAVFLDPAPLTNWHKLYGFTAIDADNVGIIAPTGDRIDLNSAKALSRRLGVTYKEIADIVETEFVNPELAKLSVLYKLDVSVRDAKFYKDEMVFYAAKQDLLSEDRSTFKDRSTLSLTDQQRYDDLANKHPNREVTGWQVVIEVAAFEQRLTNLAAAFEPPLNVSDLRAAIQTIPFDGVLVLADPDAGCNFDLTTLRYADDDKAKPIDFLRIILFARLWRKLGWSIEETDRALTTFVPQSAPFDGTPANLAKQPLKTALIYLAHFKTLDEKLRLGKRSRLNLLTLWSDIATTGKQPLYAQLFLTRSVLKTAPIFDHSLGRFLQYFDGVANVYKPFSWNPLQPEDSTVGNVSLRSHMLALQGALGLATNEIGSILADTDKTLDTAELSLPNVSLLYRYGLLAKALKLSLRELIALKQLTGLDPFKQLHSDPLAALDQDHPFSQTLEFVKVVEEMKDSGLKIEDLDYLLRHRFDETGQYRRDREAALAMLKALAVGVRAIQSEHAVPDDPGALSDEALRQKLGLALPADVVATFTAMMNGTAEFAVTRVVASADQLYPADFLGEPSVTLSPYNKNQQTLVHRGILVDSEKAALKAKFGGRFTPGQRATLETLLDAAQIKAGNETKAFFVKHLYNGANITQPVAGFLDESDYDLLFTPVSAGLTEAEKREDERLKRSRLAQVFLPFLQQRLIRQFIVQAMAAETAADPLLVESLVTDDRMLADPKSLLDTFTATAERALSATFWASVDTRGVALSSASRPEADSSGKPVGAGSAQFNAYLEAPASGAYRFFIELDKRPAEGELRFPHLPEPLFLDGTAVAEPDTLGLKPNEFLELKAGVLYQFSLDLKRLTYGDGRLLVQGETIPKGPVSQLTLYPAAAMEAAERATTLLKKALQVVQSLALSEREIRYLLTHAADFDDLSLSKLPTARVGDSLAEKTATAKRFSQFRRIIAYARLKRDLAGGTDDLIAIFEANGTKAADRLVKQVYPLIAKLTRREEAAVKATAEILDLDNAPAFTSEEPLWRLWEALQVVERFGVAPASLLGWTEIVKNATTGERRFEIARDLKEAIKARFEPESWLRVAQPIFDKLRQRQRDALVSHVMQMQHFDRMEQLYEHFLIDPGMEPVVQTSRIRLAISSLQLFIQRCLLNMEPKVHPSTINAKQWEWMKRYRVWEANRKIFLFPENWLEPEFRDDKTHLFSELEGALLQGDVSSDLVEDAFLNYLRKLDELARLDIIAMHVEGNIEPARRILHVFGRTYGTTPHKYFYRRYTHQMWTPWEPVSAEVEGDHLAPVVWRDRLYLFWVTFLDKADPEPPEPSTPPTPDGRPPTVANMTLPQVMAGLKSVVKQKRVDLQLHWSEYVNGEWSTRESGGFFPVSGVASSFLPSDIFVHVSKDSDPDGDRGVFVHLSGKKNMSDWINSAFYLAGRNSAPEFPPDASTLEDPFITVNITKIATRYSGKSALKVRFLAETPDILRHGESYTLLPCNNPDAVPAAIAKSLGEIAALVKPVFYQDNLHTFFVEPEVTETTIETWEEYVTPTPASEPAWGKKDWWDDIHLQAGIPEKHLEKPLIPRIMDGPWSSPTFGDSLIKPVPDKDWVTNEWSLVEFNNSLLGPKGLSGMEIWVDATGAIGLGRVSASPGSNLPKGSVVVVNNAEFFASSGLREDGGGFNVVSGAGFNSAMDQNHTDQTRSSINARGASRGGR